LVFVTQNHEDSPTRKFLAEQVFRKGSGIPTCLPERLRKGSGIPTSANIGTTNIGYGTTNIGYGTTNADAGVGIGVKGGIQKFDKKNN
jgi:hypothetical protein